MNYRQEILKILKLEKKSFFWIFILINIIPILEISLLYMIYLILEPTERESNVGNIASYFDIGGDNIYMIYVQEYSVQIMFVLAICLLAFEVATKFIQARILVNQAYSLFIRDAKRVLYSYLYSDYESVINIKNEKIMNNILYDSGSFPIIIKESVTILSSVILITIYTIASTKISLELSLAAVSIFVVSFAVNKKLFSTMKFTGQLKLKYMDQVLVYFSELLGGFKRIKLDGLEDIQKIKADTILDKSQKWRIIKRMTETKISITTESLAISSFILLLYIGVYLLSIQLSLMMMVFILFTRIRGDVNKIYNSYNRVIILNQHVLSYFDLLKKISIINQEKYCEHKKTYHIDSIKTIEFKDVSFSYDETEILRNINFKTSSGDRILIYGKSGEGKTTFIDVITGLYSPTKGSVLYNDKTLEKAMFSGVRKKITYISSDMYVFNETILNNIGLGSDVSKEQLKTAVNYACLSELMESMDSKTDAKVGNDGDKLSLGQRQRLILARLFVRKSDLIILDEPTSNLNPEMEKEIMKNIMDYIGSDAILIVISHNDYTDIEFTHRYNIENKAINRMLG